MAYFPLFLDLEGRDALVAGGGPVAARKARVLADFGARVLVCAPVCLPELAQLAGVKVLYQPFAPELLEGIELAVAATDSRTENHRISLLCRSRNIPVDVADSREESTFLFPAVARRGPLTVGISTGGASPAASAWVRRQVEDILPPALGDILAWMEAIRPQVKELLPPEAHRTAFPRLLSAALEAGRPLTSQEVRALLRPLTDPPSTLHSSLSTPPEVL